MKKFSNLLILAIAVFAFASCSNNTTEQQDKVGDIEINSTRGVTTVDFQGSSKAISNADIITVTQNANANQDDEAVTTIMNSLLAAENKAAQLEVNFTMSDEPVEEGIFVFGIETEEEKELNFQMFDEEGFTMAANNKINVNKGENYKALNVKSLENGTYFFKLKDDAGKELTRKVTIDHK